MEYSKLMTNTELTMEYKDDMHMNIKYHKTHAEIAQEINKNINIKKGPEIDKIPPRMFKELSKKAVVFITYIFNACIRLEYMCLIVLKQCRLL